VTAEKKRDDELTIDRPERFLQRERAVQNIGVAILTLFAVAGLAGLFGNGPLAKASVTSGGVTVRFERFARQTFRTELDISVAGVNAPSVAVTMPRAFLDRVDMLDLRPADTLKRMDGGVATFEVPAHNGSASLVLYYEPKSYGVLETDVSVGGAQPARVRQIVFF
jgi:hypothetical protein